MSNYKGSATITQGDAEVAVYCFYDGATVRAQDGGSWSGWFNDEDPAQTLRTGEASVELLDGRTGTIRIDRLEPEPPYGGAFTGIGDEP